MYNYSTSSVVQATGDRFCDYDILNDVRHDLHGLVMTLMAMADQQVAIDGRQLRMLSQVADFMASALDDVLAHCFHDEGGSL